MNSDPLFPALAPKAGGGASHSVMNMFGTGSPTLIGTSGGLIGGTGVNNGHPGATPTSYSAAVTKKNYAIDSTPSLLLEADFPSLNGGVGGGLGGVNATSGVGIGASGGIHSATLTPSMTMNGPTTSFTASTLGGIYYQQQQHQQQRVTESEFPALTRTPTKPIMQRSQASLYGSASSGVGKDSRFGLQLPSGGTAGAGQASSVALGPTGNTPLPKRRTSHAIATTAATAAATSALPSSSLLPNEAVQTQDYSLMGLLDVIRMNDPDLSTFALGLDFSTLQLDLSSAEPLYMSFVSPWGDGPSRVDTLLPTCYRLNGLSGASSSMSLLSRLRHLSEETLFFLMYHSNGDTRQPPSLSQTQNDMALSWPDLQKHVGGELCRRGWRFHRKLQLWVQKSNASIDATAGTTTTSLPTQLPFYYIFDSIRWEKIQKDVNFIENDRDSDLFFTFPFDHLSTDSVASTKEAPDGPPAL